MPAFHLLPMLALLLAGAAPPAGDGWHQVNDGDVQVWMRQAPGKKATEMLARKVVHATPAEVQAVLEDDERTRHQPHQVEFRKVGQTGPHTVVNYGRVSGPFVSDRDYFIEVETQHELDGSGHGHYRQSWKQCCRDRPERHGIVRVKETEGSWDAQSIGDGSTSLLEFHVVADPGGSIPGWLVNLVNKRFVPSVLRDLERDALRRRPGNR